jgi:hypothetical protein
MKGSVYTGFTVICYFMYLPVICYLMYLPVIVI